MSSKGRVVVRDNAPNFHSKQLQKLETAFNMWPDGNCTIMYSPNLNQAKRHISGWAMRNTNNHNINILKKSCLGVLMCANGCRRPDGTTIALRPAICDKARRKQLARRCPADCGQKMVLQNCRGHKGFPVTHFWKHSSHGVQFFGKGTHDHPKPQYKMNMEKRQNKCVPHLSAKPRDLNPSGIDSNALHLHQVPGFGQTGGWSNTEPVLADYMQASYSLGMYADSVAQQQASDYYPDLHASNLALYHYGNESLGYQLPQDLYSYSQQAYENTQTWRSQKLPKEYESYQFPCYSAYGNGATGSNQQQIWPHSSYSYPPSTATQSNPTSLQQQRQQQHQHQRQQQTQQRQEQQQQQRELEQQQRQQLQLQQLATLSQLPRSACRFDEVSSAGSKKTEILDLSAPRIEAEQAPMDLTVSDINSMIPEISLKPRLTIPELANEEGKTKKKGIKNAGAPGELEDICNMDMGDIKNIFMFEREREKAESSLPRLSSLLTCLDYNFD